MAEIDDKWVARRQALGAAQAAYLWALFISCLFYGAVRPSLDSAALIKAPFLELDVNRNAVVLSGPAVIAFLVLVFMGALRASRVAVHEGHVQEFGGEVFDLHPNALDLAFYTTHESPRALRVATYFKYPAFLTAALVEAFWLWLRLPGSRAHPVAIAACAMWLAAAAQVVSMWARRVRQAPKLLRSDAAQVKSP